LRYLGLNVAIHTSKTTFHPKRVANSTLMM